MITGGGPEGRCEGTVGGTPIQGELDGDSLLTIVPTTSVRLADANHLQGRFDARFEDGSLLECTYDLRGQNYVPGDDPTYDGPP